MASVTLQNPRVYITIAEYVSKYGKNPKANIRYTYDMTEQAYIQNDTGEYARDYLDLDDYKDEFNFEMNLAKYFAASEYDSAYASPQPTSETFSVQGAPTYYYIDSNNTYTWTNHMTDNYTLYILATPRVEAKFSFTVNFARVDEETNPILRNAKIFFNFEIDVANR